MERRESWALRGRQVWTGRLLERWGGWIFPHRRRSVRTTESRLRCATRDLENNVCVRAGPRATRVRGGRTRRCRLPDPLRPPRGWALASRGASERGSVPDPRLGRGACPVFGVAASGCGARTGRGLGRQLWAWRSVRAGIRGQ